MLDEEKDEKKREKILDKEKCRKKENFGVEENFEQGKI